MREPNIIERVKKIFLAQNKLPMRRVEVQRVETVEGHPTILFVGVFAEYEGGGTIWYPLYYDTKTNNEVLPELNEQLIIEAWDRYDKQLRK